MKLLKKYSTLDEVFLYLKDKNGYDYTLDDIYQLETENKIETYLYLTSPRIRLETIDNDGNSKYDFRYVPLKGIFKRSHSHSIFFEGDVFHDGVIIDPHMLKIHELLEDYHLDKMPFDPIPYDENHIFFSGFKNYKNQDELKDLLRFDSEQIKRLINTDIEQQTIIDYLKAENDNLKAELAKSKMCEPAENQGYLDPDNRFFSIEMSLCHDTWNRLYKNGNNSHLPHGKQVANYLNSYPDFTVNAKAIERIITITNPKAVLAITTAKED
ncbi:hypothetical protein [Psychrobacter aquimaris]|uniref:hypothetical protein n=1 Tax=Psychrobacter aquimaris TaxID=292733 RepID=UPI0018DFB55E|nr:hypothetical protein [Psychrobacter aquimaris]